MAEASITGYNPQQYNCLYPVKKGKEHKAPVDSTFAGFGEQRIKFLPSHEPGKNLLADRIPAKKEVGTTGSVDRWQQLSEQQAKAVIKKPKEQKPATEAPKAPTAETPVEQQPAVKTPAAETAKAQQPAAKKPAEITDRWAYLAEQQAKGAAKKAKPQQPAVKTPAAETARAQQPATKTPKTQQPVTEAPQAVQQAPATEKAKKQKPDGESYTVAKGDNLWNIVEKRLGKDKSKLTGRDIKEIQDGIKQIAKDNGIKNPNLIHPDQKLKINFPVKAEGKAPTQSKLAEQAPAAQPEQKVQSKKKTEAKSPSIQI